MMSIDEEARHSKEVHNIARNSVLKVLRDRGFKVGVEVGVQYGQCSERLLKNGVVEKLYGIDPYDTNIFEISPLRGLDEEIMIHALNRLEIFENRFQLIRKTSNEALFDIDGPIDFVYLDGMTTKQAVYDDISYWWPKIKSGGIMVGHNYGHSSFPNHRRIIEEYFGISPHIQDGYIWWMQKLTQANGSRKVSVVTPFYNSIYFFEKYLSHLLTDDRIDEVIIVDDCSFPEESESLKRMATDPKIKLFKNEENIGEFKTRIRAAEIAKNDWVIFLDGDNSITESYLDTIYSIPQWRDDVVYHPDFGNKVKIDYESLSGNYFNLSNIGRFVRDRKYLMNMFMNTGNYFMNRKRYLEVAKPISDIAKHAYGDIWFNYHWLRDNSIFVVPGMKYVHRRHKHSAWKEHSKEMNPVINKIMDELWNLPA